MYRLKKWGGEAGTRKVPPCTGHLQLCWFSQAEVRVLKIPAIEHTSSEAFTAGTSSAKQKDIVLY